MISHQKVAPHLQVESSTIKLIPMLFHFIFISLSMAVWFLYQSSNRCNSLCRLIKNHVLFLLSDIYLSRLHSGRINVDQRIKHKDYKHFEPHVLYGGLDKLNLFIKKLHSGECLQYFLYQ